MQALPGRPRFDQIARKWHDLAERRLAHYTELYRSGRWRLYYSQELFATRMLDVINAAKKWRALSAGLQNAGPAEEGAASDDKMRPAA
jgi:uncharacterized repeat protein (TIGR03809 family)